MTKPKKPAIAARKRPRQARSARLVEDILEGAARVLARKGARHFTTVRVAEEAGVGIGSLYQYFPSKEALLFRLQPRAQLWSGAASLVTQARYRESERDCSFRRLLRRRLNRAMIPKIASDFEGAGPPATRHPQPPASEPASAFEPPDAGAPPAASRPPAATCPPALLLTAPPVATAPPAAVETPPVAVEPPVPEPLVEPPTPLLPPLEVRPPVLPAAPAVPFFPPEPPVLDTPPVPAPPVPALPPAPTPKSASKVTPSKGTTTILVP